MWNKKKLGELCLIKSGDSNARDADNNGKYALFDRSKKIKKSKRFLFDCEALIIPGEGKEFLPRYYRGKFDLHQRAYAIHNFKPELNIKYLFYYLVHYKSYFSKVAVGATVKSLRQRHFDNLEVCYPSPSEQQRVVAKLDSAITHIDKAVVATETNVSNVESLFQNYLSNIEAPISELGELVTIKTGKLDSNAAVKNGKYPFFTCSKKIFAIDNFAFDCEAVLLAGNNASGDFNVKYYKGKFNAYQRTYVITINTTDKLAYKYLYYQLVNALKDFKYMSVGTNTKFLKIGMIKKFKFPIPKIEKQLIILKKLENIENNKSLLKTNYLKKLTLTNKLRESILQQTFTGKLTQVA